jgi:hypothetical protein
MACAVAGIPAVIMNRWSAAGFAAVAAVFLVVSVIFRRRMQAAREAEAQALVAAGASSYGRFLHQRVAAMIDVQEIQRKEISAAVAEHRVAQAAWTSLAGDVDVEWAFSHQPAIVGAAASAGDADGVALAHALVRARQPDARELADLMLERLASLQAVGLQAESLPLILDEPFEGLDVPAKRWLLEVLVRAAGRPQIVLLTDDDDLVTWALAEEPVGDLAVMSPVPKRAEWSMAVAAP